MTIAEFDDPRLTALYDAVNAYGPGEQPDFYTQLAADTGARSIVDLGCGTGMITRALAGLGYEMIGVDPSAEMLAIARQRPDGDRVRWVHGAAPVMGAYSADLAIMSGHVAQFFVTDGDWNGALRAVYRTLRPGGRFSFESRNPGAREWERWTSEHRMTVPNETTGPITTWSQVHAVRAGVVSYANHYVFERTGEQVISEAALRFRTRAELDDSLQNAGFTVERVYGDWDRSPAGPTSPEHIIVATR